MMNRKMNFFAWLSGMVVEFLNEPVSKSKYHIVDIFECKKTGHTKVVIKLSGSQSIIKNIDDIIADDSFIEELDKKTIRTLTFIATVEKMKPDYSIVVQQLTEEADEYILEIKSRNNRKAIKKSLSELSTDKKFLSKMNPMDANRIGYLAGIKETVKEYKMRLAKR